MTRHRLEVQGDFVERIRTSPIKALAELVWNSLDADATEVGVTFERSPLGGLEAIVVRDNGTGMTNEHAVAGFTSLGGSWKDIEKQSRKLKRQLHGKQGRGRLLAFSLRGSKVTWRTVAEVKVGREGTDITVTAEDRGFFDVSDPQSTSDAVGTTVRVEGITDNVPGVEGDEAWLDLVTEFALYVEQYKPHVTVGGRPLDPGPLQADRTEYDLEGVDPDEPPVLTIVEWTIRVNPVMYLCDPSGIALEFVRVPRAAAGFEYTAYLRWHGIEERSADLAMAEANHPVLSPLIEQARHRLATHFADRQREQSRTVIEDWQKERVYPYDVEPAGVIETATRELFEVVAVAAATAVNASEDKKSRRFTLALLKQAVENEPSSIDDLMQQVLDLTPEQRDEFRHLLKRTTLTAMLKASRSITDRLDFLESLRIMVFDEATKDQVLERSELHRILENETWVFGEQFSLTASDRSLTKALKEHIKYLGRDDLAPSEEEVLDAEGHRRILDLMLARRVPHASQVHEHLIVELKAPRVIIGDTELTQIKNYARAVARDPRFDRLDVRWDFVIVSTEMSESVRADASQTGRERGLVADNDGVRVWARTWSEIIAEADYRLNFVKERLGYAPTDELALEYLRQAHAQFVPKPLRETPA